MGYPREGGEGHMERKDDDAERMITVRGIGKDERVKYLSLVFGGGVTHERGVVQETIFGGGLLFLEGAEKGFFGS